MKSKRAREAAEADDKPADRVEAEAAPAKKRKRSDDGAAAEVKKAKKDKKDKKHQKESRKERKEKRKDLQNLPEQDGDEDEEELDAPMADAEPAADKQKDEPEADVEEVKAPKKEKKSKKDKKKESKEKKAKKEKADEAAPTANGDAAAATEAVTEGDKKQDKKEKKDKKDKKEKKDKKKNKEQKPAANGDSNEGEDKAEGEGEDKKDRHIVFVGNLPFTATPESITAHFAALSPVSVRCMSDPNDAQSRPCRGFAFVEFGKVWHQRTCLDKFHHSMFDDGQSPARRINVELTAGGGGKTQKRQTKIREKNEKLNENRTKRIEREKQVKTENTAQEQLLEDSIHPSRRARVPGNF